MKHRASNAIVLTIALASLLAGCSKPSDADVTTELKTTLAASCAQTAGKSAQNMPPETVREYCDCSAEKTVSLMGAARIREIADGDSLSPNDQQLLQQAGTNCAVVVLQKMLEQKAATQ